MVDDMKSFVAAAEVLKERGAYKIYVLATHGLLSSDAPALIEDSPIDEVIWDSRGMRMVQNVPGAGQHFSWF